MSTEYKQVQQRQQRQGYCLGTLSSQKRSKPVKLYFQLKHPFPDKFELFIDENSTVGQVKKCLYDNWLKYRGGKSQETIKLLNATENATYKRQNEKLMGLLNGNKRLIVKIDSVNPIQNYTFEYQSESGETATYSNFAVQREDNVQGVIDRLKDRIEQSPIGKRGQQRYYRYYITKDGETLSVKKNAYVAFGAPDPDVDLVIHSQSTGIRPKATPSASRRQPTHAAFAPNPIQKFRLQDLKTKLEQKKTKLEKKETEHRAQLRQTKQQLAKKQREHQEAKKELQRKRTQAQQKVTRKEARMTQLRRQKQDFETKNRKLNSKLRECEANLREEKDKGKLNALFGTHKKSKYADYSRPELRRLHQYGIYPKGTEEYQKDTRYYKKKSAEYKTKYDEYKEKYEKAIKEKNNAYRELQNQKRQKVVSNLEKEKKLKELHDANTSQKKKMESYEKEISRAKQNVRSWIHYTDKLMTDYEKCVKYRKSKTSTRHPTTTSQKRAMQGQSMLPRMKPSHQRLKQMINLQREKDVPRQLLQTRSSNVRQGTKQARRTK